MLTLIDKIRAGKTPQIVKKLAKEEQQPLALICKNIAQGKTVIPLNSRRHIEQPCAIGKNLRVKINANIGLSPDASSLSLEIKKLKTAIKFGADTIMDLSVGENAVETRKKL